MSKYFFPIFLMLICRGLLCFSQFSEDTTITVYFPSGEYKPETAETEKLIAIFKNRHFSIEKISGFADTVGSSQKNLVLSRNRSKSIADYLIHHGYITNEYTVENYGEDKPVSKVNNALNRRVEINVQFFYSTEKIKDTAKYTVLKVYNFDKIYFIPNQPIIDGSSLPYLDDVVQILKSYPAEKFEIRGHVNWPLWSFSAKDSGYRKKMNQLSTDRAKAVYDILVDKGIPPERMIYRGMGNTQMLYPNARKADEQLKNMRVEILVLKKGDSTYNQ